MVNPQDPEGRAVDPQFACPDCGERDQDRLAWQDDDEVECQTCGRRYRAGDDEEGDAS